MKVSDCRSVALIACLAFLPACGCATPQAEPPRPDVPVASSNEGSVHADVNDAAEILSDTDRARLGGMVAAIRSTRDVDLAVLTVTTLGGTPIETFSIDRSRQWQLGATTQSRGVLVTIAVQDRQSRIEVSRNLEDRLSDELCKALLIRARPAFAAGDYGGGLAQVLAGLDEALTLDRSATSPGALNVAGFARAHSESEDDYATSVTDHVERVFDEKDGRASVALGRRAQLFFLRRDDAWFEESLRKLRTALTGAARVRVEYMAYSVRILAVTMATEDARKRRCI